MAGILNSEEMATLVTIVEEAARSTREGVKHFVEPGPNTLRRATNKRHHIVFGRRGSGKSSLLHKAAADLTLNRRPIAHVNLEAFKGHSYPDVLMSVLIATFKEFKTWMDTAAVHPATRKSFWEKLFGKAPQCSSFNRKDASELSKALSSQIEILTNELHRTDDATLTTRASKEAGEKDSAGAKTAVGMSGASAEANIAIEKDHKAKEEIEESFKRSKIDFLHRNIMEYQNLFRSLGGMSGGDAYLFLDDLYHIRRADQAQMIDYFHRIAKDHNLWLKIGTIRHRTCEYTPGDPPIGMKLGDDADEIDLDLTLEKYSMAKDFLKKILTNFAITAKLTPLSKFLTDGALERLVLASGGVARDFLSIFRRSVDVARERGGGYRGERINAEDVNVAAGEYDSSKQQEFKRDTLDDSVNLEKEFQKVRDFCLDNNTNCFLLDKDLQSKEIDLIHELVDLKLIHLIRSRVTVSGRQGKVFEGYMLDWSQYSGARKRRKLQIVEFWKSGSKEALRKVSLIYSPQP